MSTNPTVVVDRLASDDGMLRKQFLSAFDVLSLREAFNNARAVFIKPNLTFSRYKQGVTTRKEFVDQFVSALREINSKTSIYIGEGEGGYDSFSMSNTLENMGFYDIEKRHENVKVVNLSKIPRRAVVLSTLRGSYEIALPSIFLDEIDFSISCPLAKVHCMTRLTLSFKNLWGCVPDIMRLKHHYMFDYVISRLSEVLKFRYAFLDGLFGLDVNGPMVGEPVELGWFVGSNSLGAFDHVVSGMMRMDWKRVRHMRIAHRYGIMPEGKDITVIGSTDTLARRFKLRRNFWNYVALAAFRSKSLTHFLYFSRFSKILHDLMYMVRKRAID